MDPKTDTDFIKELDRKVEAGFAANAEDHEKLMTASQAHAARVDQVERTIEALQRLCRSNEESNLLLKKIILGDPAKNVAGCRETQRNQEKFLQTFKRLAWMVAAPIATLAVGGVALVLKHLLAE